jgi:RNA-directed DNA polymerase
MGRVTDCLRFGKYGLTIHPEKTRRVAFRKPQGDRKPPPDKPGSFDFPGFTHFWARSRKGTWILKRKTAASRFTRAIKTINQWCRLHRHDPIAEQHKMLCQNLRGHAGYYGIAGNCPALSRFRFKAICIWRKWLMRRRRAWRVSWDWFRGLLARFPLPQLHVRQTGASGLAKA